MPLQEAKISTNIRLRFRTHQENALLLLAAGRTDYCLVGLDTGRIKFLFKVDDFVAEVRYFKKLLRIITNIISEILSLNPSTNLTNS